jgi:hypothetical protein
MALLYLASAVVAWVAYAAKTTSMPLAVPAFWTLAAVVLVATSIRRAR